ncbi:MAG: sulfide/dihydroorotate dehydrogenase-like FAD/NAD-binding protein [Alphaproteobacteria bacterium]
MAKILEKKLLAKDIYEITVDAPKVVKRGQPGQFVLVMADEKSERIPLTIADFNREKNTLTMVMMAVGVSTMKIAAKEVGESFYAVLGPLGTASEIENFGHAVMVAGGVGSAPIFPIARALREAGNKITIIQGARTKDLLFWDDKLAQIANEHIVCTDDGTFGRKGRVTEPLLEILEQGKANSSQKAGICYAIGPEIMMKVVSEATRPYELKTIVSLNTIMIDGTGMCGGCRVLVHGETKFTCVDGPEFDGHGVDWNLFSARQRLYKKHEHCSLERYRENKD